MVSSELVGRVRAMSSRPSSIGGDPLGAISLAMGEPAEDTPRHVVDAAIASLASGRTRYERISGSPRLREDIAQSLNDEVAARATADNVVVTHGASGGLAAAMLTLVDPGDVVVLPEPTYSLYADQVAMAGGVVRWVPNDASGRPRLDRLDAAMRGAKLLVLCNPSNPTGYVLEPQEVTALVELARAREARVIFDEAYRDIVFDPGTFASSASLVADNPHVLCCGTFSKSFAMTGWRLGWVLADPRTADAINLVHRTINGPLSTFVQDAASAALSLPREHLRLMVSDLRVRRDLVCAHLGEIPGVEVAIPQGAFYAFPRIDCPLTSAELTAELAAAGVLVRAGSEYGPSGEGFIRLSFTSNLSGLQEGMERLRACLQRLRGEPSTARERPIFATDQVPGLGDGAKQHRATTRATNCEDDRS